MPRNPKTTIPTDLRRYASQTRFRAVIFFIAILILVGLGLIWRFYGGAAALFGLLCLFGALLPIGLIVLFGVGLDGLVRWLEKKDQD